MECSRKLILKNNLNSKLSPGKNKIYVSHKKLENDIIKNKRKHKYSYLSEIKTITQLK